MPPISLPDPPSYMERFTSLVLCEETSAERSLVDKTKSWITRILSLGVAYVIAKGYREWHPTPSASPNESSQKSLSVFGQIYNLAANPARSEALTFYDSSSADLESAFSSLNFSVSVRSKENFMQLADAISQYPMAQSVLKKIPPQQLLQMLDCQIPKQDLPQLLSYIAQIPTNWKISEKCSSLYTLPIAAGIPLTLEALTTHFQSFMRGGDLNTLEEPQKLKFAILVQALLEAYPNIENNVGAKILLAHPKNSSPVSWLTNTLDSCEFTQESLKKAFKEAFPKEKTRALDSITSWNSPNDPEDVVI